MEQSHMSSGQLDAATSGEQEQMNVSENASDTVKYETYRKTLGEAKKAKEERNQLLERIKAFEDADLERKGQHEELISSLRSRNEELEKAKREMEFNFARSQVSSQLSDVASKHGCLNTDKLIRLMGSEALGAIEVDNNFKANSKDLEHFIELGKKENPFLFKSQARPVSDGVPANGDYSPKKFNPKGKTSADIKKELMSSGL